MKIFFTRHGQTAQNVLGEICGRRDVALNQTGLEQAEMLAQKVKALHEKYHIDRAFCSPLQRARITAQTALNGLDIPLTVDSRVIECNYGKYEGQTRESEGFEKVRFAFGTRMPGGESLFDMAQRSYNFLDELYKNYTDENILIISHGGISRIIESYFRDVSVEEYADMLLDNCEIRGFETDGFSETHKAWKKINI